MPPQKRKILWVEDSARFELAPLVGPVLASRRYDLTLAENASAASERLLRTRFDAIIVDIRLPPGVHPYWVDIFKSAASDRVNAKLGLALLSWLFGAKDGASHTRNGKPVPPLPDAWKVLPQQVAVFSVENKGEIGTMLELFGVTVMHEKRPGLPDTILLQILSEVLAQSSDSTPGMPGAPGTPAAPGAQGTQGALGALGALSALDTPGAPRR